MGTKFLCISESPMPSQSKRKKRTMKIEDYLEVAFHDWMTIVILLLLFVSILFKNCLHLAKHCGLQ